MVCSIPDGHLVKSDQHVVCDICIPHLPRKVRNFAIPVVCCPEVKSKIDVTAKAGGVRGWIIEQVGE